jgi:hypothetical protein
MHHHRSLMNILRIAMQYNCMLVSLSVLFLKHLVGADRRRVDRGGDQSPKAND